MAAASRRAFLRTFVGSQGPRVIVTSSNCWATKGQPCDYCVTACPLELPAVRVTDEGPALDRLTCTGCGECVHYCTGMPRALAMDTG